MDYGTDMLLVDDDIVIGADGDITTVSGSACVAQDIDQSLKIVPGRLLWDAECGSSMPLALNTTDTTDTADVVAELERVASDDPRVDPASVRAREVAPGRFRLEFRTVGTMRPEVLEYDLGTETEE